MFVSPGHDRPTFISIIFVRPPPPYSFCHCEHFDAIYGNEFRLVTRATFALLWKRPGGEKSEPTPQKVGNKQTFVDIILPPLIKVTAQKFKWLKIIVSPPLS